jgi:hypothetical protein
VDLSKSKLSRVQNSSHLKRMFFEEFANIDYPIENRISSGIKKTKDLERHLYAKYDYKISMFNNNVYGGNL